MSPLAVAVTPTPEGVTPRLVTGSDEDGVDSWYGLAHGSSSSTAPGREAEDAGRSLGVVSGVASVTKTAGGWLSKVPLGASERWVAGDLRAGDVCV